MLSLIFVLGACAGTEQSVQTSADSVSEVLSDTLPTDTEKPIEYISLVKDGKAQFVIISENADYQTAAETLATQLLAKSGVAFETKRFITGDASKAMIVIGASYNDVDKSDKPAPYGTYGVVYKDGNIYICGDNVESVTRCVTEFTSSITLDMAVENDSGKKELSIPDILLFVNRPSVKDGSLLGAPIYSYRIVRSKSASATEAYMVEHLAERIRIDFGYLLDIVNDDTAASEHEIVLGNTERSESKEFYSGAYGMTDYSLQSNGGSLYVGYGSVLAMNDACDTVIELFAKGEGAVSVKENAPDTLTPEKKNADDIRIMTSNIQYVGYDVLEGIAHDYVKRGKMTAELYSVFMPDIIGLQECNATMRGVITPYLPSEYAYVDFSKMDGYNKDIAEKIEYFPVLYRTDKWKVEACGTGDFPNCGRPWGYVWVTFSRVDDPTEKFTLINLHYIVQNFISRGEGWEEYGEPLAEMISAEIEDMLSANPDIPIAVTGDYNDQRTGPIYGKMIKGLEDDIETAFRLTDDINMTESEKSYAIDHITVTKNTADVVKYRQIDYCGTEYLSDHKYYFADLHVK